MSTFGMDKATMKEHLTKLAEESKKDHNFVYFDLEDSCKLKTDKLTAAEWSEVEALLRDSALINRDKAQKQKKTEELKSRLFEVLEDYLSCQTPENQKRGKFIFRLIYAKYGDQLNPDDLSLDLGRKKKDDLKGKTVKTKASILNYILTLLEDCEPPPDVLELHEYMKRTASIVIPAQYVVNKCMKKIL